MRHLSDWPAGEGRAGAGRTGVDHAVAAATLARAVRRHDRRLGSGAEVSGERTEAATPRRLEQLRDEGRAARSPELGSAIGLLAGCVILQTTAGNAATRLQGLLTGTFTDLSASGRAQDIDVLWAQQALGRAGEAWLLSIAPLLLVLPVLGIGIGFAQGTIF
ncbi:MAG: EscU/YscU/HrcU family type III secretion system export apparatus switch protein, partial [Chloroflexi bacterium]